MMNDIKEGRIHTVIVYRLDRISRSILDFSNMMEVFAKHGVQFISATEKFDTSSPMGNAMLNICIVFAQLERETIQKRVADAYYSRSRKGLYMGGPVPYGFRKTAAVINGVHTSVYEPVPEEAEIVRLIYEMYSEPYTSYGDVIDRLNELGIRKRNAEWSRPRIRELLVNPVYVRADYDIYSFFMRNGADTADQPDAFNGENGCYSYRSRANKKKGSGSIEGSYIVIAPHKGIVDSGLWLKCREKCMSRRQMIPSQKAKNSWLCGKIKCGECGYALIAKQYDTRRYMFCSNRLDTKDCSGPGTIYTDEIEQLVSNEIKKKLAQFGRLDGAKEYEPDPEQTRLELKLAGTVKEISDLLERVQDADKALFRYINVRMTELDKKRADLEEQLRKVKQKKTAGSEGISDHAALWEQLGFDDKRLVTDALIRVIYAAKDRIIIQWRI